MKTVATLITAATLAVASTAASAWYAPYGYAPYGYGVPVAPAAELTEEQKQAMADQQAKAAEYFQAMSKIERGEIDGCYQLDPELPQIFEKKELLETHGEELPERP